MWPTAASQFPQQFPSYSNRKCKKSPFSRTAGHIFVSPASRGKNAILRRPTPAFIFCLPWGRTLT